MLINEYDELNSPIRIPVSSILARFSIAVNGAKITTAELLLAMKDSEFQMAVKFDYTSPKILRTTFDGRVSDKQLIDLLEDASVRRQIASWTGCTSKMLSALSDDLEARKFALSNPKCPEWIYYKFADSEDVRTRVAVAASRGCPASLIRKLARDDEPRIRVALAANAALSMEGMYILSSDRNPEVRAALSANKKCAGALLENLSQDEQDSVKIAVLRNPIAPSDMALSFFAESKGALLLAALEKMPVFPLQHIDKLAASESVKVLEYVAKHPQCPPAVLAEIVDRDAVAAPRPVGAYFPVDHNEAFPSFPVPRGAVHYTEHDREMLKAWNLAEEQRRARRSELETHVVPAVLAHPGCPESVLLRYAMGNAKRVASPAVNTPSFPDDHRERAVRQREMFVRDTSHKTGIIPQIQRRS